MMERNLSPQAMFVRLARDHRPSRQFEGFEGGFSAWKEPTKTAVLKTLGKWPEAVHPNPELTAEWEDRGVRKQRFVIDVGRHISASVQVNLPSNVAPGKPRPTLLCWHGHGMFGKDPVMGNPKNAEIDNEITRCNYDYGHQMAARGFVTFAIDWMGCGDRNDRLKPHFSSAAGDRDWCNLYYLHATMLGTTPLALNLAHGRAATDFACSLPWVDPDRLGVMGLSGGGTMSLWTALTDPRFGAVEIICYSDLFALFGIRDINYCGSQITPGLFELVDVPDLQGLLAPVPLLVDIGANDECFQVENAMACFRRVRKIYEAAGAGENLNLDLFAGGHGWSGGKSETFFRKHLGALE